MKKCDSEMALPDLVVKAIDSAGISGRNLSWKLQEIEKGTLTQVVWKTKSVVTGKIRMNDKVHTNWNNDNQPTICTLGSAGPASGGSPRRKRILPSRLRRNARRLQAFLESKKDVEDIHRKSTHVSEADPGKMTCVNLS